MSSVAAETAPLHPRIRELIDFIDAHRRGLHQAASSVSAEQRERKPDASGWSVAEVLEHVSILERRVAGLLMMQVAAAREKGIGPDEDASSVVASYPMPHVVVDRTRKIVAPRPVIPTGTLDTMAATAALEQSRATMLSALHDANGVSLEHLKQVHPVLGELNLYHWIVALGLHDDRHAAQIREIGDSFAPG